MKKYYIKTRHRKDNKVIISTFEDVDAFINQLRIWLEEDAKDEKFFNQYLYECYVITERGLKE